MASSSDRAELSSGRVKALLLSPVVVLFASAVRLLIISNYDTTTATTLAASSGVVGTLLGTIVPLLPLFLPAIFIFFIIVRRWGLVLLTALFTAFVSPAAVHSVRDGLKIAGDTTASAKGIWHGVLQIWPGLQDGLIYLGRTVQGWGEWILGYIWPILTVILRALGLDERGLRLVSEKRAHDLREWGNNLHLIWSSWTPGVRVAALCALAALLWTLYAPPWDWFPPGGLFRKFRRTISEWSLVRLSNTSVRSLGIAAYGLGIAAVCGFSVLYVEKVYEVPVDTHTISAILRQPWLPAEKMRLSSGGNLVGYTMSIGNGWHVFLDEKHRTISYLHATEVTQRTVCHVKEPPASIRPLIESENIDLGNVPLCSKA